MKSCSESGIGFAAAVAALFALDVLRHLLAFGDGPVPFVWDAAEYWRSGGLVAEGDWFQLRVPAYRTPLYFYFVAIHRTVAGQSALLSIVILQHVLVMATSMTIRIRQTGRPNRPSCRYATEHANRKVRSAISDRQS